MKAIWKGSLSFGLVTIPVELYSAVAAHPISFTLLHKHCQTPIKYLRWCTHCNKEVGWDEILKGLPTDNDTYFTITPESLEQLKPEKSNTIDILEFVEASKIPPIYFDQHYYIAPKKTQEKAYFLFQEVLAQLNKVAIGRFILKEKEHIVAIQPYQAGFLLTTLNYLYEIKPFPAIAGIKVPQITKQEIELAQALIKKLSKKKFDMSHYKDTFAEKIQKMLKVPATKKKAKIEKPKKTAAKKTTLIDSLQASLQENRAKL